MAQQALRDNNKIDTSGITPGAIASVEGTVLGSALREPEPDAGRSRSFDNRV